MAMQEQQEDQMEGEGTPEGSPSDIAKAVSQGMMQLGQMLSDSGAPPEAAQELAQIQQAFDGFLQKVAGGGPEQQPKNTVSPVNQPEGRPVGPAGV